MGLVERPKIDSFYVWNHRAEGGSTEVRCFIKAQPSPDACACFGENLDGTSDVFPSGACPTPTQAPSSSDNLPLSFAPSWAPQPTAAPAPKPTVVKTDPPAPSPTPSPTPAPTPANETPPPANETPPP